MNAIMNAFTAHSTMSKQALDSERVKSGLRDILLGLAQLYEALKERSGRGYETASIMAYFRLNGLCHLITNY